MEIIQSFYYSSNNIRQNEIELCLFKNLNNQLINKIHLFITENDSNTFKISLFNKHENREKIVLLVLNHQPTYPELFSYAYNLKDIICCICNSDIEIVFEDTNILPKLNNENIIYFLSRYEYDMSCPQITNFQGSHDAFVFHSDTLKLNIENKDMKFIHYIQNTSGIEALLTIYFIELLKYKIFNPCWQIKLIHHHKSNIRLWINQRKPPVGYTAVSPIRNAHGIHNKYIINPCKL